MLRNTIESYTHAFFEKNIINKDKMNISEAVVIITNELLKIGEIRQLCESPSEIEEIVHITLNNFF